MRAQRSGRIVNVSSIGGKMRPNGVQGPRSGAPHGAWYHATKFAVEGLSDSLRMELRQFGIDVVVIQPGAIKTEWNAIARERLLATSGDGAYGPLAQKHAAFLRQADEGNQASEPDVVGEAIARALLARKPKTRYAVGGGAKAVLAMRRVLSDRLFDRVMLGLIGRAKV